MINVKSNISQVKSNTQNARYNIPESAFAYYTRVNDDITDENAIVHLIGTYGDLYPIVNQVLTSFQNKAPDLLDLVFIKFADKEEEHLKIVFYDTNKWEERFFIGLKDLGCQIQLQIVGTYCERVMASYREHLNAKAGVTSEPNEQEAEKPTFNNDIEKLIEEEVNRRVSERLDKIISLIEEIK